MAIDLVIDIGNSRIKGGFFEGKKLLEAFALPAIPFSKDALLALLTGKPIRRVLVSSVNAKAEDPVKASLKQQNIDFLFFDHRNLKLVLDVDEPEALGQDRIANAYGALLHFPLNDAIVIDIGTSITADFIEKEGRYTGGMIYPGEALCAKALSEYTDRLPLIDPKRPEKALGKTTKAQLESGIFYGQLGAIERMIDELKALSPSPSSIKVIATGGAAETIEDLKDLVDFIDPHLTLLGLCEILEEMKLK